VTLLLDTVARGSWGALLVLDPGLPLRLGRGRETRTVRFATRVLGTRHLIESFVLARSRTPRTKRIVDALDLLHAASMLALANARPDLRRDALLSAASAGGLVVLSAFAGN
jgi:hypothetical protein